MENSESCINTPNFMSCEKDGEGRVRQSHDALPAAIKESTIRTRPECVQDDGEVFNAVEAIVQAGSLAIPNAESGRNVPTAETLVTLALNAARLAVQKAVRKNGGGMAGIMISETEFGNLFRPYCEIELRCFEDRIQGNRAGDDIDHAIDVPGAIAEVPERPMPLDGDAEKISKPLRPMHVTLPWNEDNPEEGEYGTTVMAVDDKEAVLLAAQEMAETVEKEFDSDSDRDTFIQTLVRHGGFVVDAMDDLKYNLGVVFGGQLFPDGVRRAIDHNALAQVLAEHRDQIVPFPLASI